MTCAQGCICARGWQSAFPASGVRTLMIEYLAHNAIHGFIFFESVILLILLSNIIIRRRARQH